MGGSPPLKKTSDGAGTALPAAGGERRLERPLPERRRSHDQFAGRPVCRRRRRRPCRALRRPASSSTPEPSTTVCSFIWRRVSACHTGCARSWNSAWARGLDWRGNTNYRASGGRQPSEATLDTRQVLLAGFHDFPGWEIAPGRRAQPFLGAGLGITDYRLGGYVQRFPEPDDPQGSLRRGPGGEIPFTALPGGSGRNLTWMLTAGITIRGRRQHPLRLELPIHRCGRNPD